MRRIITVLSVALLFASTLGVASAQPPPCEGYGAVGSDVHTTEGQVNNDMADEEVSDVTINVTDFENDMVNVPSGTKVIFDQVTFAGNGEGHLLEVKEDSQVDVTGSAFIGHASEDDIQFQQHKWSRIGMPDDDTSGNCFDSASFEDHIDIKETTNTSRNIGINHNTFAGSQWCVLANNGPKTVHFRNNSCNGGAYFRGGVHDGVISNNTFNSSVWLDEVNDYIIESNNFASPVRYGAGTTPENNWFRSNTFNSSQNWDFRQQGPIPCKRYNNDISALSPECVFDDPNN